LNYRIVSGVFMVVMGAICLIFHRGSLAGVPNPGTLDDRRIDNVLVGRASETD